MGEFERKMRLYLLNLIANPVSDADAEDLSTVSSWTDPIIAVSRMKERGIVSNLYSVRNLKVDWWFLKKRTADPPPSFCRSCSDPASIILFHVVLQALKDLKAARPCDIGIWIDDIPPDLHKCQDDDHICYQYASWYLAGSDVYEPLINIRGEVIQGLVRRIKNDPIFKTGPCNEQ